MSTYTEDKVKLANAVRKLNKSAKLTIKNLLRVRADAYDVAVLCTRILTTGGVNDLQADLRVMYPNVKAPIDHWLLEQFKVLRLMGMSHEEFLRAANQGVKKTEFVSLAYTVDVPGTSRVKTHTRSKAKPPTIAPPSPAPDAPVKEQARAYMERAAFLDVRTSELAEQLKEAKRRVTELERENATLKSRIRQLEALTK